MTRFLDELARSMARPMPRSRALRLLAGAIASAAVPGVVWKGGSAAARGRVRRLDACGGGHGPLPYEFFCADSPTSHPGPPCGPLRGGAQDCCDGYEPQCCSDGPADNGRQGHYCCEATCECHKGLCCTPGSAKGVDEQGRPLCCEPGWLLKNGRCVPKVCGPDITDELGATLSRVNSKFAEWSKVTRTDVCVGLVTLPSASVAWDILELGPGGREKFAKQNQPDCSTCGFSVQVGRDCHYAGSVNYAVFGRMMRLCHDFLDDSAIGDWFSQQETLELVYIYKNITGSQGANFQAANEWALVGYRNGALRPIPAGDRKECTQLCSKEYSGPGFTVQWSFRTIRPR